MIRKIHGKVIKLSIGPPGNSIYHFSARPMRVRWNSLKRTELSRLMNDPVSNTLAWLTVPNKLPSDIPKFEGKVGEDPGEHVTTFHLWCCSNSLHDDYICFRVFQRTLISPAVKWYIELPGGVILHMMTLPWLFLIISSYPYVTTSAPNSCRPSENTKPHIFRIIFKSGVDERGWLNPLYHQSFF